MPDHGPVLLDTDILIDYLRGEPRALAYLTAVRTALRVSCLTLAELYVGVRNGVERDALASLEELPETVPVDREIGVQGVEIAAKAMGQASSTP